MGNTEETDCRSPLRGFGVADAGNAYRREARPHPSAASREIGVCHLPQRGRRDMCKSADLPEMGNTEETDCHSPLRGFAMTDIGDAYRREARPHLSAASREIGVCHLPQRGRRDMCKSADLPERGNTEETDCRSPLRGFAMTDAGDAYRREARPHSSAASREIGVCHLPQRGRQDFIFFQHFPLYFPLFRAY